MFISCEKFQRKNFSIFFQRSSSKKKRLPEAVKYFLWRWTCNKNTYSKILFGGLEQVSPIDKTNFREFLEKVPLLFSFQQLIVNRESSRNNERILLWMGTAEGIIVKLAFMKIGKTWGFIINKVLAWNGTTNGFTVNGFIVKLAKFLVSKSGKVSHLFESEKLKSDLHRGRRKVCKDTFK